MPAEPRTFWLLRHAETANPTVFHGSESDVELGEFGHRQATALAEWFAPLQPDLVISSGMKRAIQTSEPIVRRCQVSHRIITDLHERRVGALSGVPFSTSQGPWHDTVQQWSAGNTAFATPGAETYDELRNRLSHAWNRVVSENDARRVVVVAHGVVCKVLLLHLLQGGDPAGWAELGRVTNGAVSELILSNDQKWEAKRLLEVPAPVAELQPVSANTQNPIRSTRSEA